MDWLTFKIELAIRLSLQVYHDESYAKWANSWLDGSDRSSNAASAVADNAAYAASAAAYAASAYAASVAAYAASVADAADASINASIKVGAKLENVVKFL